MLDVRVKYTLMVMILSVVGTAPSTPGHTAVESTRMSTESIDSTARTIINQKPNSTTSIISSTNVKSITSTRNDSLVTTNDRVPRNKKLDAKTQTVSADSSTSSTTPTQSVSMALSTSGTTTPPPTKILPPPTTTILPTPPPPPPTITTPTTTTTPPPPTTTPPTTILPTPPPPPPTITPPPPTTTPTTIILPTPSPKATAAVAAKGNRTVSTMASLTTQTTRGTMSTSVIPSVTNHPESSSMQPISTVPTSELLPTSDNRTHFDIITARITSIENSNVSAQMNTTHHYITANQLVNSASYTAVTATKANDLVNSITSTKVPLSISMYPSTKQLMPTSTRVSPTTNVTIKPMAATMSSKPTIHSITPFIVTTKNASVSTTTKAIPTAKTSTIQPTKSNKTSPSFSSRSSAETTTTISTTHTSKIMSSNSNTIPYFTTKESTSKPVTANPLDKSTNKSFVSLILSSTAVPIGNPAKSTITTYNPGSSTVNDKSMSSITGFTAQSVKSSNTSSTTHKTVTRQLTNKNTSVAPSTINITQDPAYANISTTLENIHSAKVTQETATTNISNTLENRPSVEATQETVNASTPRSIGTLPTVSGEVAGSPIVTAFKPVTSLTTSRRSTVYSSPSTAISDRNNDVTILQPNMYTQLAVLVVLLWFSDVWCLSANGISSSSC